MSGIDPKSESPRECGNAVAKCTPLLKRAVNNHASLTEGIKQTKINDTWMSIEGHAEVDKVTVSQGCEQM